MMLIDFARGGTYYFLFWNSYSPFFAPCFFHNQIAVCHKFKIRSRADNAEKIFIFNRFFVCARLHYGERIFRSLTDPFASCASRGNRNFHRPSKNNNFILSIANCTIAMQRYVSTVRVDDLFRTIGNWRLLAYARPAYERSFRARSHFSM